MDWSTPGFLVLHYLLEFAQTHAHWVLDVIQSSHPLLPPSPLAFNLSKHQSLFNDSALYILSIVRFHARFQINRTVSWKYLTIWRPSCHFFPEHRVTHSWFAPWVPFRGCWRSVAIVAHNFILIEVDGKCQFVVDTNTFGHKWERGQLLGQKVREKPHRLV